MILIGVHIDPARRSAAVAVIESTLRYGKKQYRLLEDWQRSGPAPHEELSAKIVRMARDGRLSRKKRLYSQDRRPKKTLTDRPRVVASGDVEPLVASLRDAGVVVEWVRFDSVEGWEKEAVGRALGADYTVDPGAVRKTAGDIEAGGRLETDGADQNAVCGEEGPGLAAAAALWFREVVPYNRSYRAK